MVQKCFYLLLPLILRRLEWRKMRKAIAMILLAMLGIASFSFITTLAGADTQFEGTWVRMGGIITQWGSDPVFGWIGAHAGMVNKSGTYHEWARVHAIWSYDRPRLNCTKPPLDNFTFTVYAAKLNRTTDVAFDYLDYDFYISGLWNVVKITTTITVVLDETGQLISIDVHREFERIVTNGTGELRVFLYPLYRFELSIEGIDLLSGFVKVFYITHVEIKICDINDDGKVDLWDLVKVAKRYRAVPGLWTYVHEFDLNFNNEIDIGDLTSIAANIGV